MKNNLGFPPNFLLETDILDENKNYLHQALNMYPVSPVATNTGC